MKTFVIASCLTLFCLTLAGNVAARGIKSNKQVVNKEKRLDEIIASGYAYFLAVGKNGEEYLCYGEINKMDFAEKTNCSRVRATLDKETGRPREIIYLNR